MGKAGPFMGSSFGGLRCIIIGRAQLECEESLAQKPGWSDPSEDLNSPFPSSPAWG